VIRGSGDPGAHRLHADGAARGNPGPAAYGFVLDAPDGSPLAEGGVAIGRATNNVAEYLGLIAGLERALELGVTRIEVRMDSELVVRQMTGRYRVRHPGLVPLFERARALMAQFPEWSIAHVGRAENGRADAAANRALDLAVAHSARAQPEGGGREGTESAR
jgi:ribonuclease H / adenosylcobalamin/alpha-ribazole phosphatase